VAYLGRAFHSGHMSELRARFATELRAARHTAGLTQEALAEAADISVDYLSKVERGLNSPSLETLAALVSALDMDLARILQADPNICKISTDRREAEARVASMLRNFDDRKLAALTEIAETIARLVTEPPTATKTEKVRKRTG
jgi:transcriptional regulator with XRE-family HTH domain